MVVKIIRGWAKENLHATTKDEDGAHSELNGNCPRGSSEEDESFLVKGIKIIFLNTSRIHILDQCKTVWKREDFL